MIASTALFFPYTNINASSLHAALAVFQEISLFRLPKDPAGEPPAPALDLGLVKSIPVNFIPDEAELDRIIQAPEHWAAYFKNAAELALLKRMRAEDEEESAQYKLMAGIRGRDKDAPADPDREAQIFLHFARSLDAQNAEVDQIMARTLEKESRLGDLVGAEYEDEDLPLPTASSPEEQVSGSGLEMISRRLSAWGRLLKAFGDESTPLFTSRPEVTAELDLQLAKVRPGPGLLENRRTEALELLFQTTLSRPDFDPENESAWEKFAAGRTRDEAWLEYTAKLPEKTWRESELENLKQEAAELIGRSPAVETGPRIQVSAFLLPGETIRDGYLTATGLVEANPDAFSGPIYEVVVID